MKPFALAGILIGLGLGLCLTVPASGQSTGGAACLQITPGARADAMGRAMVTLPNDATAVWWNPAALALRRDRIVSLMHTQLVPDLADDVYYENLAYAMHLPGWGGVGASLIYLTYGKSTAVDVNGDTKGDFTSWEISPQVSLGTELTPGIAAGVTLKYVYIMLAPDWATEGLGKGSGDSFGADIGLLLRSKELVPAFPVPLSIGVNVQNLGPNISFISQDQADPMPRNLKLGIGAQLLTTADLKGVIAYDFNKSLVYSDEKPVHNMGAELTFRDFVAGRIGYIYDKQGDIIDPTFGAGFLIDLKGSAVAFDYASVPQAQVLSRVNKFSVSFKF
jgi:hypothetical protein